MANERSVQPTQSAHPPNINPRFSMAVPPRSSTALAATGGAGEQLYGMTKRAVTFVSALAAIVPLASGAAQPESANAPGKAAAAHSRSRGEMGIRAIMHLFSLRRCPSATSTKDFRGIQKTLHLARAGAGERSLRLLGDSRRPGVSRPARPAARHPGADQDVWRRPELLSRIRFPGRSMAVAFIGRDGVRSTLLFGTTK